MNMHTAPDAMTYSAHDLLWVADADALAATAPLPPWATTDWLASAPVVVRREMVAIGGAIPVGLRGAARNERHKTYLARTAVMRCAKPEMLMQIAVKNGTMVTENVAALCALRTLVPRLDATGLIWGPTGGVGFALASGLPVLRSDSDLDLVVRADSPLTNNETKALRAMSSFVTCRLDMQIETGHGAFSLAEWASGHRRVLLKTDSGPFLTDDPWNQGHWLEAQSGRKYQQEQTLREWERPA